MNPVRQSEGAQFSAPRGAFTHLLREGLDSFVTPGVRDELLRAVGWDTDRDGPADGRLTVLDVVEGPLFSRLADVIGLVQADEARQHLMMLLRPVSGVPAFDRTQSDVPTRPPAASPSRSDESFHPREETPFDLVLNPLADVEAVFRPSDRKKPSAFRKGRSPKIRSRADKPTEPELDLDEVIGSSRSLRPADFGEVTASRSGMRSRGDGTTVIPPSVGQTLVVWSGDPGCAQALHTRFGTRVDVQTTASAERLSQLLDMLDDRDVLVLIDRRTAATDPDLALLPAWTFVESRVVVWGAPSESVPALDRLLEHVDKAVACSAEAGLADLAHLCAQLMGTPIVG